MSDSIPNQSKPLRPDQVVDGKPYRKAVSQLLNQRQPQRVLDLACGSGWLAQQLDYPAIFHGVDAYAEQAAGYEAFFRHDINHGLPTLPLCYDAAVICEAMAYVQNPGLLISSISRQLSSGGTLVITDPNPIHMSARLNYLFQGFPRSHSAFVANQEASPHMPWMSLGLFQYWLLLGLHGFRNIKLHEVNEKKPKHAWERIFGLICKSYYRYRERRALNSNEQDLWRQAGLDQHIYGRRLVISAQMA